MPEARITAARGSVSESGSYILRRLPAWMPKDPDSGNFKLIDTVGRAVDRLDEDLEAAEDATNVQDAATVSQVRELARLVDIAPEEGEELEKYRTRVMSEYQLMTNEGTAKDIIENAAALLGISTEKIQYIPQEENGTFGLRVPQSALDTLQLSTGEFVERLERQLAAGYRIDMSVSGTFTYKTPGAEHTAEHGYGGLDANGNPNDTGGTYAGLIN